MTDVFDPVGLAEIAAMTDPPMSAQLARYVMGRASAPKPVQLARLKVWRRSEVAPYLRSYAGYDLPGEVPSAQALEVREWAASGRAGEVRRAAGLSLGAVAAELGVSKSTLARWEHGEAVPGAVNAAAWHRLLTRLAAGSPGAGG